MAQTNRRRGTKIETALGRPPHEWNFFGLVRALDRQLIRREKRVERTGFSQGLKTDGLRFRQSPSLAFPPSDISGFRQARGNTPAEVTVHCFGLLGCSGPMPLFFTEYVFQRLHHHKDHALKDFLDMFHHRMISLYYRAWAINQITVNREWQEDPFSGYIGALINIKDTPRRRTPRLSNADIYDDDIPKDARLYYSGRLIQKQMNMEGLCTIIGDYFGISVRMQQFMGQWIGIPWGEQFRLGESEHTGLLGRTCIVGRRIWDINQKFKLVLGPMPLDLYEKLVPGSRGFAHLKAWIDSYVGMDFDWDVQLLLKAEEIPPLTTDNKIRLGFTSWLRQEKGQTDADDLVISGSR